MRRSPMTIAWVLAGLPLSALLPGCATTARADVEHPVPVAVEPDRTPPADLLQCARRDAPLAADADAWAIIPARRREELIAMARAAGWNADQLDRLVNWNSPGRCPEKEPR